MWAADTRNYYYQGTANATFNTTTTATANAAAAVSYNQVVQKEGD